jgi:hypothetical protein
MRRIASALLVAALALAPTRALADEFRTSRAPVSLDLPARARLGAPLRDGVQQHALAPPATREVLNSEDATLVLIGAAVIGVVLLVVIVSAVAS